MYKRFIALGVLVILVGFVTQAFAAPFDAASPEQGRRTQGDTLTRAGAVAMLVESDSLLRERLQHHIRFAPPLPLFEDIDYTQWYAPYVETAFEAGIITGSSDGLFHPDSFITEEQMILLAVRYRAMSNPGMNAQLPEHNDPNWLSVSVSAALQNGMDLPFPIRPGQPMARTSVNALLASVGIESPETIAITHTSGSPARVTASILPIRPINTTPRPTIATPAQTSSAPTVSSAPASQKPFAISLPTLGVKDLTITHPSDPFTKDGLLAPLKNGVGHLFSYPGKGGKILVYGHSSSYAWDISEYTKIFRQINKLNIGDLVHVTYNGTVHTYKVTRKQAVPADDMSAYQGTGEELILYTCWPPDSIKERYLVHAVPVAGEVAAR